MDQPQLVSQMPNGWLKCNSPNMPTTISSLSTIRCQMPTSRCNYQMPAQFVKVEVFIQIMISFRIFQLPGPINYICAKTDCFSF